MSRIWTQTIIRRDEIWRRLGNDRVQDQGSTLCVGLRIDVDTYRGTRDGVPALLEIFEQHGIHASFFFSVGPDNMGRHLWRLLNPMFLMKMIRSKASSLYGWDILLRGLLWPGPNIARAFGHLMRKTTDAGHEVGIHAWDHHAWQRRSATMSKLELDNELSLGISALSEALQTAPTCSASAGWKCNEAVLACKEKYGMRYHSDCRGSSIFRPTVGEAPATPQIPVTLPTYDEIIGRNGITDENFNDTILAQIHPGQLNVLTVHAEVEGLVKSDLFEQFLLEATRRNIEFVPLGDLLSDVDQIQSGRIEQGSIDGRDGHFCVQAR